MSNELNKGPYKLSDGPIIMPHEPDISMNGMRLTAGQAMTVRVALEGFASDLIDRGLGDDEHGKKMTASYLRNINDIRYAMYEIKVHD